MVFLLCSFLTLFYLYVLGTSSLYLNTGLLHCYLKRSYTKKVPKLCPDVCIWLRKEVCLAFLLSCYVGSFIPCILYTVSFYIYCTFLAHIRRLRHPFGKEYLKRRKKFAT